MQSPQPWIITGDFNCIRRNSEKLGSSAMNATAMSEFNDFVDDATLLEMPTTASTYTWCNMKQSRPILCHLDCTLISSNCLLSFPHYATHIGPRHLSDHAPLIITLDAGRRCARSHFKFYNHWASHLDFLPLVALIWRFQVQGNPTYRFTPNGSWLLG